MTTNEKLCSVCVNTFDAAGDLRWRPADGTIRQARYNGCKQCPIAELPQRLRELNVTMVRVGLADASDGDEQTHQRLVTMRKRARV